jgi:hypothetical protein
MRFRSVFLLFSLTCSYCLASHLEESFLEKLMRGIPDWMQLQADQDLAPFRSQPIQKSEILEYYETSSADLFLIKFTIKNNQVSAECKEKNSSGVDYRSEAYEAALKTLANAVRLPDVVFLVSMHDAFTLSQKVPVFAMCKREQDRYAILLPDFDALKARFQVLSHRDLTVYEPRWESKINRLIWRGSTAQASLDEELMRADNVHRFSRVILCELSRAYPELIDATFTFYAQGGEHIPSLQSYKGKYLSYENLMNYKYQLYIDGNVSPYSASGWKFFSNSLIFKPDSPWTQWYYGALKPFEHYVPVRRDLADLVEKVLWARSNDAEARAIAKRCREFAISHLTLPDNLLYLYYIIDQYSQVCL